MKILALNLSHNASCAIIENGKLIFSIEEGRLSKRKNDKEINHICNLLKNKYFDYVGYTFFDLNAEIKTKKYYKNKVINALLHFNITYGELIEYPFHHLTHAYSSFYNSNFEEAVCLIIDNGGLSLNINDKKLGQEIVSIIKVNKDNSFEDVFKICRMKESDGENLFINIENKFFSLPTISLAGIYEFYKYHFKIKEAGAVMGYSCYGKENNHISSNPFFIKDNLFYINPIFLYQSVCNVKDIPKEDICHMVQKQVTKIVLKYIKLINDKFPKTKICLSGGLFQNCMINYEIIKNQYDVFVDPISHDGGTSIGLAQYLYVEKTKMKPIPYTDLYLGNEYNLKNLFKDILFEDGTIQKTEISIKDVAELLTQNKSIGIYQGRSETGPRALGNRSILHNPADSHGKEKINLIKKRDWFRPTAGTVLHEHKNNWFNFYGKESTEFMSYAVEVKKNKQTLIPAITHVDGTCRVQTLKKETNKVFYSLIDEFYKLTGIPILLNSSLNLAGNSLCETDTDLLEFILNSKIDYVYVPELNLLLNKR